ncbi:MAG: 50S ribosomal protein L29 [Zetaproteobacteria bacterium CG_4_9_14_3_um_filter_49_83]|nr:MAG: 50S ribosomal protein L29 [Zetaproteobacteria bacterium CG1_02_49_23]PIQ32707.1 MAG: 50S ribosomal protein L29 [Zetaproteobacteria bacterium CG17_big_fil_post_rev_8_21_14_2_50_50_13]PIV29939.1 MAG: 50S ribosomal protein L29 [Zetaproteobacteria bacterium CG02_land_8_20_14_3_00_50_9]PIY55312.1 MAG: 50S ribosomal protein L29 [Zetaproteobacteria bacterium CG_4_10_14_0_8_um_filter_49_80]PJA36124.1 MAG: 50S ribosomal protein L29 [Zetaproteobacteria bacterium CG_4_9_14_3_um_filter_49_83]
MKAVDLRKLEEAELTSRMEELAAEHMKLRFQKATMQLTNTARIGQVRKEIARIQTILAER